MKTIEVEEKTYYVIKEYSKLKGMSMAEYVEWAINGNTDRIYDEVIASLLTDKD